MLIKDFFENKIIDKNFYITNIKLIYLKFFKL